MSESLFADRFRDPKGWLIDALPWPLRRLWIAARLRCWPPDAARYISFRRPKKSVFEYFEELHRRDIEAGHFDA